LRPQVLMFGCPVRLACHFPPRETHIHLPILSDVIFCHKVVCMILVSSIIKVWLIYSV
jgi:hypothetical protein